MCSMNQYLDFESLGGLCNILSKILIFYFLKYQVLKYLSLVRYDYYCSLSQVQENLIFGSLKYF